MRVLVLGVTGLLGSQVYDVFSQCGHTVAGTARSLPDNFFLPKENVILGVDAFDPQIVAPIMSVDAVINCIGVVPRMCSDQNMAAYVNSIFPHMLESFCQQHNKKLIHISTDCVFDGKRGGYQETDLPTATDFYGKTKALGEIRKGLTIRTSIIGHEFRNKTGLLEWFLSQSGDVKGFQNAIWSGVTARELAKIMVQLLPLDVSGILHVGSAPINKFDLLMKLKEVYQRPNKIVLDTTFATDKSLRCERFLSLGLKMNEFDTMLREMKDGWRFNRL